MAQPKLYKLPISMVDLLAKKQLETCDVKRSIAQNLHLILTTQFGSYSFDHFFGCPIWDMEYENVDFNQAFKDTLTRNLIDCFRRYETRLTDINVQIDFKIEELPQRRGRFGNRRIKRKLEIRVSGEMIKTKDLFTFQHKVYLAPFSYN